MLYMAVSGSKAEKYYFVAKLPEPDFNYRFLFRYLKALNPVIPTFGVDCENTLALTVAIKIR